MRHWLPLWLALLLTALAACAPAAERAAAPASPAAAPAAGGAATASPADDRPRAVPLHPPQRVRLANVGLAAQAPTFLALEQGYFRELGIEIEIVNLNSTAEIVALLSSDQLDVGFGAIAPQLFNAVARGVGIRLVADHGSNLPGRSTPSLTIRSDLLAQHPWTGYSDLRGLKVAVQQLGTLTEYYLELMLQRGGLTRDDVEIVALPFPDMNLALANKALDAAINNEPWATQLEQAGVLRKIVYTDDVDPGGHVAGILYSETFARNTPAARNWMVAYLRGIRDYWDAYDGRLDFQRVIDVLQKYTPLKDAALICKIPPTGQNPAGYLDPARLAAYQDWFVERGLVTRRADISQVLDQSFLDYANAVLGPYQPVEHPRRPSC
ncbi:MAG TPA: ABC transporter substrate-binding protein [Chloroflexota bacterium]|jgi:NitT/TauT family transport system substrate-binding protein|nr:ABC transporter substrate-binding protein [Chloroflexota bacterium]